ncbi:hypothetical protein GCM10009096_08420 [Parasphingorhabdus litoris]|uniref:Uncharacterized protein n=1 Tax=Parasphingorhabdus litoris TaxID=394733 RepID=A0ABN1A803_9SPHN
MARATTPKAVIIIIFINAADVWAAKTDPPMIRRIAKINRKGETVFIFAVVVNFGNPCLGGFAQKQQ